MAETPPAEGGVLSAVAQLFQRLRDTAENRLELFLVELKEQRIRLFDALFLMAIAVVCGLMTLVMLTFTVVFFFRDTHPLLALSLVTVVYAVATVVAFLKLRSQLQQWQDFACTLEEFKKDAACFKKPN